MIKAIKEYFIHVGDAFSQLLNCLILFSDNPNESISGKCWRLRDKGGWRELGWLIDALFDPFEPDHCQTAYLTDLQRAQRLVDRHKAMVDYR